MTPSRIILAALILLGLGYGIGRYALPPKTIETVKEVKVIERVKDTVTVEITRPDGTKEVTTVTKEKEKEVDRKEQTKIVEAKPNYRLHATSGYSLTDKVPVYGVYIEKRLFANISAGIGINSQKTFSAGLSYEF